MPDIVDGQPLTWNRISRVIVLARKDYHYHFIDLDTTGKNPKSTELEFHLTSECPWLDLGTPEEVDTLKHKRMEQAVASA